VGRSSGSGLPKHAEEAPRRSRLGVQPYVGPPRSCAFCRRPPIGTYAVTVVRPVTRLIRPRGAEAAVMLLKMGGWGFLFQATEEPPKGRLFCARAKSCQQRLNFPRNHRVKIPQVV